jgi:hypothetical protein
LSPDVGNWDRQNAILLRTVIFQYSKFESAHDCGKVQPQPRKTRNTRKFLEIQAGWQQMRHEIVHLSSDFATTM